MFIYKPSEPHGRMEEICRYFTVSRRVLLLQMAGRDGNIYLNSRNALFVHSINKRRRFERIAGGNP
jgi:hypothetical protein